jgi:transcriptional regulator with XRE-family HTH domain
MTVIDQWTGRHARALQAAMRLTGEAFAEHLGISPRTVAKWRKRPDMVPSAQLQEALDTSLHLASPGAQTRFAASLDYPKEAPVTLDEAVVEQLNAMLGELSRVLAGLQPVRTRVASAQEAAGERDDSR